MSTKVAVVIPNHKAELNELEKISLDRCRKVLSRYPLIHAVPAGQNFSYIAPNERVAEFPAHYFKSVLGYNILSVSQLFYEAFLDFDYILIYQLDAFVFYDALEEFCALGYDLSVQRGRFMSATACVSTVRHRVSETAVFVCAKSRRATNLPPERTSRKIGRKK